MGADHRYLFFRADSSKVLTFYVSWLALVMSATFFIVYSYFFLFRLQFLMVDNAE